MVFFLKKAVDNSTAAPLEREHSQSFLSVVSKIEEAKSEPISIMPSQSEGQILAQQIVGNRVSIPKGFIVRAEHFQHSSTSLIAGMFEGELHGIGTTEISRGAMVQGTVIADTIAVYGVYNGEGTFNRLIIKDGGQCSGVVKSASLTMEEGGVFNGEYSSLAF